MNPDHSAVRRRVISVYLTQGTIGLLLMLWLTWLQHADAVAIVHHLGPNATILMAILVAFAAALQLLKFELTNVIYVSHRCEVHPGARLDVHPGAAGGLRSACSTGCAPAHGASGK